MKTNAFLKILLGLILSLPSFSSLSASDGLEVIAVEESEVSQEIDEISNAVKDLAGEVKKLSDQVSWMPSTQKQMIKAAVDESVAKVTANLDRKGVSKDGATAKTGFFGGARAEREETDYMPLLIPILIGMAVLTAILGWLLQSILKGVLNDAVERKFAEEIGKSEAKVINNLTATQAELRHGVERNIARAEDNIIARTYANSGEVSWEHCRDLKARETQQKGEYESNLGNAIQLAEIALDKASRHLGNGSEQEDFVSGLRVQLAQLLAQRGEQDDGDRAVALVSELLDVSAVNQRETCAWILMRCGEEADRLNGERTINELCQDNAISYELRKQWRRKYQDDFDLQIEAPRETSAPI